MEQFFSEWGEWTWWIIAVTLAALELMVPGVLLIWLAGAAAAVGLITLAIPMAWQWEVTLFALLSLVSAYAGYRWSNRPGEVSDNPTLNRRGQSYVGKVYVVAEAIQNGRGKVRVGDTLWQAAGPDAEAGASVRVTGVEGTVLTVEPQ